MALSSPLIKDDVSNYTVDCPLCGLSDEYFRCDYRFDKGYRTTISLDYSDGSKENVTLMGTIW